MDGPLGFQADEACEVYVSQMFLLVWGRDGRGGRTIGKYDLILETEGKDYVVPFAYKRTIPPGTNDRFTLQIASEVSTYQRFRIRLTTADGREIISPRCRVHFLCAAEVFVEGGLRH